MGWGEFEASIRIVWNDEAEERPVLLNHFIKLYPSNAPVASVDPSTYMTTTVPVVSEKYDEVVFTNPKVVFHKQLLDGQQHQHQNKKRKKNQLAYPLSHESSVIEHFRTYGDESDVKAMLAAREFLQKELRTVKDRLIKVDDELEEVKGLLVAAATSSATTAASTTVGGVTDGTSKKGGTSSSTTTTTTGGGTATKKGGSTTTSSPKSSKKKKTSTGGGASSSTGEQPASKKAKSS